MYLLFRAMFAALLLQVLLADRAAADWQRADCRDLPFALESARLGLPAEPFCLRMFLEENRDVLVVQIAEVETGDYFLHVSEASLGTKKVLAPLGPEKLIGLAADLRPDVPEEFWSQPVRTAGGLATFAAAAGSSCLGYVTSSNSGRSRRVLVKCARGASPPPPEEVEALLSAVTFR